MAQQVVKKSASTSPEKRRACAREKTKELLEQAEKMCAKDPAAAQKLALEAEMLAARVGDRESVSRARNLNFRAQIKDVFDPL